jgi:NADH-quinone oxidoreductase subunit L
VKSILFILLLFPLATTFINAVAGKYFSRKMVGLTACVGVLGALAMAVAAIITAGETTYFLSFFEWIRIDGFSAKFNVYYDPLAAVMALMVTFVSSVIHLYSVSFMRDDEGVRRYFCYMNLFVFSMLTITLADSLIFVFLGWEGVGFCSYALIGFWYSDLAKAKAGVKAFVVTRIGDIGFLVAIALLFHVYGYFSISRVISDTSALTPAMAAAVGFLLLWAAVGKSAQLPLSVWLPDAMAGPSPVSALIHAATMVTAGVYLLMRLFPVLILTPDVMTAIAFVGGVGTFYAACSALAQKDIKRVLAYSTMSQVGYMFLGVGAGDIIGGMFHLLSHAFFKSLLFLSAGCVIQALAEEHNIFKMGNLRKLMPGVFLVFLVGALSLSAFPLIGGYFSKDRILLATFIHPGTTYRVIWFFAAVAALLTPIYTFRLFFTAFDNRPDGPRKEDLSSTPRFMVWIIVPLAILALFDGLLNLPFGPGKDMLAKYLSVVPGSIQSLNAPGDLALKMGLGSAVGVLAVLVLTWFLYHRPKPEPELGPVSRFLFNGFYLDRLYHKVFVRPYTRIAWILFSHVDEGGLDAGFVKTGEGFQDLSDVVRFWTSGRISTYLKTFLWGFTAVLCMLAVYWRIW